MLVLNEIIFNIVKSLTRNRYYCLLVAFRHYTTTKNSFEINNINMDECYEFIDI